MINSDKEAKKVISSYLNTNNRDLKKMLSITNELFDSFSFVDNQTYPRPSHPLEEYRADAYITLVAVIISLRTTLENERRAVAAFRKKYLTIYDVASSTPDELAECIRMAGMPVRKANTIIKISQYIISELNGEITNLKSDNVTQTRDNLLKISGIGEKSADCILELGFDLPSIVVDVNVFRVVSRMYMFDWALKPEYNDKCNVKKIKDFLESFLPRNYEIHQVIHTMILLQGKHICMSKPKCNICTVSKYCEYWRKIHE